MTRDTIIYPDNSKGHVNASTREQMLLAGDIERVSDHLYRSTWKPITMRAFTELIKILPRVDLATFVRFYPGLFLWLLAEIARKELLESPEAMALKLELT